MHHSQRLITFIPQVQMYSRVNTRKYDASSGPFVKILHFLLPPHSGSVSLKRKLSWLVSGSWSKLFVVPLKNKLGNKRTCIYITKLVITWHFHCHSSQVRMGSVSTSKEHIRLCLRFSSLFAVREYALDQSYIHVMNVFLFVSTQKLHVTSLEYKPSILRLNHQDNTVKDMSTYSVHRFPVK